MANYIASNYVSPSYSSMAEAAAAIETKLETPLDSTTQAVWLFKIFQDWDGKYKTVLVYKDV